MKNGNIPKRVLIINAHPDKQRFCTALAEACQKGAVKAGAEQTLIHLADLRFDPILHQAYRVIQKLEPDLQMLQSAIMRADHLVLIYPVWWMNCPALLKGMLDRVFLPGVMYKFRPGGRRWERYMKGKSARLILTMDTPPLLYRILMKRCADLPLVRGTLRFTGFGPVRTTYLGPVKHSTEKRRLRWIARAEALGQKIQ
jgi:NAD(P)H dehydrogenase (quinone)